MKLINIFFIVLILSMANYAQLLTVKDIESGQTLELVTISSDNPKLLALTNASGKADISPFIKAEKISFQMLGYKKEVSTYNELKQNDFIMLLTPTNISLDQVVVSATKWNQPARDLPGKITSISPKEFEFQNPQTAADLLSISGEVLIQKSQQGGGSPMIRGFATNRLLMSIDGVRMNTAIFRSGNIQNVISLDPFATERTEVMFGPGSIIYGSDAIGGVMSFYTLSPQFSLSEKTFIKGKASVRNSSANNEFTGHFDINVGWKKFAMISSFTYSDYGDLKMGSFGPDDYLRRESVQRYDNSDHVVANNDIQIQNPTGYSQINLMQKFSYKPDNNNELNYAFHYSTTTDYDRYDRHIRYKNGMPRSGEWFYGPQVWMMHNLNYSSHKKTSFYDELTTRLAYQRFEESRHDRDFNDVIKNNRVEKVDAWSVNLDLTKNITEKFNIIYGFEYVLNDVVSEGTSEDILTGQVLPGPSRYPQSDWTSMAGYLNMQYKFSPELSFSGGIRYNYFSLNADFETDYYPFPFETASLDNGAVTGSAGLIWHPDDSWSVSANVSTGFRSPNVDDVGKIFDSEPGSVVVPNPDLKPEYALNGEIGIAKIFDDFLKVDLTGYYTLLTDALVRRDFTLNGADSIYYDGELSQVQAIQNAAEAYVWGLQGGIEIKFPAGFGLSGRINYQKGEEELDDGEKSPLRHAGPLFSTAHLTYTAQKLKFDLYANYNGEIAYDDLATGEQSKDYLYASDENGNPYSPSWYTLNLKILYRLSKMFSVAGGVENLTDQRYRPYSSGIAAPGRNVILSFTTQF